MNSPVALGVLLGLWALLAWLSFPRANFWLLAHFALCPLTLVAARGEPTRRVAVMAYLAGLIWWLFAVRWLIHVTFPGYFVLCLYLACYPLAYVMLVRLASLQLHVPLVFAAPIVWVGLEYVRGWMLTGFPWFLAGHSQPTVMIQIADLVGSYGVSFVVVMTGGLCCDLLTQPLVRRSLRGTAPGRTVFIGVLTWLLAIGFSVGYGTWRVGQTESLDGDAGSTLRVAVVQPDVPQSNKLNPTVEQDEANFAAMLDLSRQAVDRDADAPPALIVWPETMVPSPINEETYEAVTGTTTGAQWHSYRDRLRRFAAEHGVPMIVGAPAMEGWQTTRDEQQGFEYKRAERRYNAAHLIDHEGNMAGRYDKVHRVPFGEYLPLVETMPWFSGSVMGLTPYEESYNLQPGERLVRFEIEADGATWRLAAPICFEDVVSYVCRRMVYRGGGKNVDVLINLTNDGWYPGTAEGPQHEQIARFRCVENRVPMARSVNRGVSSLIDSAGRVIRRVEVDGRRQMVSGFAVAELARDGRSTLFGRIGDAFGVLCMVAMIALGALGLVARAARRRRP